MGKLKHFVRGEIRLQVESLELEKFINLSTKAKIRMWNVERENFTTISFSMFQDQYKNLKKIVKKTDSRTKVRKKNGMNFIIDKIIKRKFFIIGLIVFVILIFLFSSMILRIEIEGNKNVDNKRIISSLKTHGVTYGKLKYGYKLRAVENRVLEDLKEVSVVTIKFVGTKVLVNIVERTMPPEMDTIDIPRDIIAIKEGVISGITALKGQSEVRIGDYIKKGDILIAGVVKDAEGIPIRVTEASGEVIAKTWYEVEDEIDFNYKEEKLTGRQSVHKYFNAFNRTFKLNNKIEYEKYDKIKEINQYKVLGYKANIEKITETYKEKIVI
ncbi:MAG: sporulation protein YqfD, partial [Clostridium sp.]